MPSNFRLGEQVTIIYCFEQEREREFRGIRPPPECALRQVTALLSAAPLLEDGMYGVGCLGGLEEKGSCQTGIADPMQRVNSREASAHFPFGQKKK